MNPIMEMGQLNKMAMDRCNRGDLANAKFMLRQALMRSRACTSPLPGARIRNNLAIVLTMRGKADCARKLLGEALETLNAHRLGHTKFHEQVRKGMEQLAA
ncbi:Flp pilus assembly protein TadD [Desulfobaculum xiamenense]|uniref:Flp pilus assembly protein TadD n=1 Tax=Desulfobaculum xiamenense TaxID=995050 RepID=A0A846QVI5_9BACT|nr:hypothetical protein [Desulfobaculum xiamenense]NJB69124.1 Flp pilus assembly protein TadD [Desulfobaculum xiamenense]